MSQLPPITRSWLFSPNNRISFVSLNDTMARLLFGLKDFLVRTVGYTVKYTCNGVTGPTSSVDHTDRWVHFSNCTTRGTSAATAQSFVVLTDGNGCDLLMTYQGASDDVARISFSPSGVFVPAGTSNQQPTATADEQVMVSAVGLISPTTSLDRVWHAMATTDRKIFRVFIYRANLMTYALGLEFCNTLGVLTPGTVFSPPVVGWASTATAPSGATGGVVGPASTNNGGVARINSVSVSVGGGGEGYLGGYTNPFSTLELQAGGAVLVPVSFATATANMSGKIGNRIDCWFGFWAVSPTQGDALGDLTHVFMGSGIHPWNGVSYPVTA